MRNKLIRKRLKLLVEEIPVGQKFTSRDLYKKYHERYREFTQLRPHRISKLLKQMPEVEAVGREMWTNERDGTVKRIVWMRVK